jgi:tRNA U34 5-carboxymethylaminomethyl modifying GTPase MnmE/TrmE
VIVIHSPDDPIAALATPAASSALAVIRVSGPGSLRLLSPMVAHSFDPVSARGYTVHRCVIRDGD